ncbi:hypothetical protein [Streptomyces sp. NPDC055013]
MVFAVALGGICLAGRHGIFSTLLGFFSVLDLEIRLSPNQPLDFGPHSLAYAPCIEGGHTALGTGLGDSGNGGAAPHPSPQRGFEGDVVSLGHGLDELGARGRFVGRTGRGLKVRHDRSGATHADKGGYVFLRTVSAVTLAI